MTSPAERRATLAERRATLIKAHGRARAATSAERDRVLAALKLDVPARDVLVFFYRDQHAADAYAASNRAWTGAESLGTIAMLNEEGTEIAGVLDLRTLTRGSDDQPR